MKREMRKSLSQRNALSASLPTRKSPDNSRVEAKGTLPKASSSRADVARKPSIVGVMLTAWSPIGAERIFRILEAQKTRHQLFVAKGGKKGRTWKKKEGLTQMERGKKDRGSKKDRKRRRRFQEGQNKEFERMASD